MNDIKVIKAQKALAELHKAETNAEILIQEAFPVGSKVEWAFNHSYGRSRARGKVVHHHLDPGYMRVQNQETEKERNVHIECNDVLLIERPS